MYVTMSDLQGCCGNSGRGWGYGMGQAPAVDKSALLATITGCAGTETSGHLQIATGVVNRFLTKTDAAAAEITRANTEIGLVSQRIVALPPAYRGSVGQDLQTTQAGVVQAASVVERIFEGMVNYGRQAAGQGGCPFSEPFTNFPSWGPIDTAVSDMQRNVQNLTNRLMLAELQARQAPAIGPAPAPVLPPVVPPPPLPPPAPAAVTGPVVPGAFAPLALTPAPRSPVRTAVFAGGAVIGSALIYRMIKRRRKSA